MAWEFSQIPVEIINAADLTPMEFRIWVVMSQFSDKEQKKPVHPGITKLEACTGASRKTVIAAIDGLQQKGYVKAKKRPGKITYYYLSKMPVDEWKISTSDECEKSAELVENLHQNQCKNSTSTGVKITPEREQVNKNKKNKSKSKQDHTLTSVEANASVTGQSSLLGGITPQQTGKQSKMARSLSKIDLAQKTGDWSQVKDQDLFYWFVSEHNKTYTRPLVPNPTNAWEVKLFRDNFLAVYDIPRNAEGLEIIRKFIDKYKAVADPKYRDQISLSVFSISALCDEIVKKATKINYLEQQARLRATEEIVEEVF